MKIELKHKQGVLTPFVVEPVPPFMVICGRNGCGKSQFIQLVERALTQQREPRPGGGGEVVVSDGAKTSFSSLCLTSEWHVAPPPTLAAGSYPGEVSSLWAAYGRPLGTSGVRPAVNDLFRRIEKRGGFDEWRMSREDFELHATYDDVVVGEAGTMNHVARTFVAAWQRIVSEKLRDGAAPDPLSLPWVRLNQLLEVAGLPYQVNSPDLDTPYGDFTLQLSHRTEGWTLQPSQLSSGELVILKLFLLLFSSEKILDFPEVLLLDEPDAHLHPQMASRFVSTLQSVLVEKHGVRIIMTTHSPTTVAVCPEAALFEMKGADAPERFEKVSRDRAIGLLSSGVPALRVSAQNVRQVFVENDSDVRLYTDLQRYLTGHLDAEVSLSFIASGNPTIGETSGCSQVHRWTENLRRAGAKGIFGIVDWDASDTNRPEGVHVLAPGVRYTIENCILDPLVLGFFMVKQLLLPELEIHGITALAQAENSVWQKLVDHIVEGVKSKLKPRDFDVAPVKTTPLKGPEVTLERWYFMTPGHELQDAIEKAFPNLAGITKRNVNDPHARSDANDRKKLPLKIVEHVGSERPELFPREIVELFLNIQKAGL